MIHRLSEDRYKSTIKTLLKASFLDPRFVNMIPTIVGDLFLDELDKEEIISELVSIIEARIGGK